jgi:TolB-like protein/Tfp pilus assembly protein PilF
MIHMVTRLKIGEWDVDPPRNELRRGAETVRLEHKVIELLVHLARTPGEVVSREALLDALWPGVVVGDDALTQAMIKLRKALGDDAHQPTYIETISKRGYRLVAPVVEAKPTAPGPEAKHRRRLATVIAITVASAIVAVAAALLSPRWPMQEETTAPGKRPGYPTIAVLPFANLSGDRARDFFSDGMTDDIIGTLGRFTELRLISRASVEAFRNRSADAAAIREELGARYVVKGSVREADGRLRVTVELSDAESGMVLWADKYDGEGPDVFEIQDRIVLNIAGVLATRVSRHELDHATVKPPAELEAYHAVLKARALVARGERGPNREAREMLARALEKSPDYAEAHALMAAAHTQRAVFGWMEDAGHGYQLAEQSARRAIALGDPGSRARAHGALGTILVTRGHYDLALVEANKALELNPSDAYALDIAGMTLLWLGRFEEAATAMETARRFDPAGRGPNGQFPQIVAYYMLGRYPEALAAAAASAARYPEASFIHAIHAVVLAQVGRTEESRHSVAQVRRTDPFFKAEEFGNRFVKPENYRRLQEGLRKAGL